eukprot:gnl/TRDRNA2_/TRDRNA2_40860_c0_seq1.p1 gnl/TRDRNA2_/TRDRNA2_40860_c0~~gnl/TRDRNA2_/TRDRNA2_40860_c0_seq1.p1  ORF type:complete len:331 (+),score=24.53 gnl/TRDRNA2_/TRDRNA2_40860_c0_seq1:33-1025(+)
MCMLLSARVCCGVFLCSTQVWSLHDIKAHAALNAVQCRSSRPNTTVTYGVVTSDSEKYRTKLSAVMATWAAQPLLEDRFFAVAPAEYRWARQAIVPSNCSDSPGSVSCKEAEMMKEAARRDTGWLVVLGEDNYVDTKQLEVELAKHSADAVPKALGWKACSDPGGMPCPGLTVSFCGGIPYALNRAALAKISGKHLDHVSQEYARQFKNWPNDRATSCMLHRHGVKLEFLPGIEMHDGFPTVSKSAYEWRLKHKRPVMHYISPDVMQWLYAKQHSLNELDGANISSLEAIIFDELGCCSKCATADDQYLACRKKYSSENLGVVHHKGFSI